MRFRRISVNMAFMLCRDVASVNPQSWASSLTNRFDGKAVRKASVILKIRNKLD